MSKNKKILFPIILAAVLLISLGSIRIHRDKPSGVQPLKAEVMRGPLTILVAASGEIQAIVSNKVIPAVKRAATVTYMIPNGTRVNKDEIIARLNAEPLEESIEKLKQGIEDEELALNDEQAQLDILVLENTTSLKIAEDNVQAADMEMKKFIEADEPMNQRSVQLDLKTAESDLLRSEKRYQDLQSLLGEGFITEDEVEEGRMDLETARVKLETAKMNLKIMGQFTIPLKRTEIENKLSQVRTNLKKTQTSNQTKLINQERKVLSARRTLEKSREKLKELEEELEAFVVRAPSNGVVNYGDADSRSWWRTTVEVGQEYRPGLVMFTIPDFAGMKAVVQISESDIDKVKLEQGVNLRVDAVPDQLYRGQVTKVGEVADQQSYGSSSGVKEFTIEIAIEDDAGLRPGYSCDAEILIDVLEKALQVPMQAVFKEDDSFFVYLVDKGRFRKVPVSIGQTSATHVEVTKGLEEDQLVYLSRPEGAAGGNRD